MTCIVGIVDGGLIRIGGDSAGISGWDLSQRADRKVFVNGPFVMGFTSSFRMGQLLAYSLKPPTRHPDVDVMAFMVTTFIDAVRETLKAGGFAKRNSEAEEGGAFLVGYQGRLFQVSSDYQVGESNHGFDACGCGAPAALGALHATRGQSAPDRIQAALAAAEAFSAGVRSPFHVVAGE